MVSDIGKDGSIGDEDLNNLVNRVYCLEKINQRYKDFINELGTIKVVNSQIHFQYLSILKDDPQLPFEILPFDWTGDKANSLLKEKTSSRIPVLSGSEMGQ